MTEVLAAIYARGSSEQQAEEHTIASQVAALRARVAEDSLLLPVEREFLDDGYSGATLVRPARRKKRLTTVADLCIGKNRVPVHLRRKDLGQ
jgi:site-specific DNA recombinase